MRSLAACLGLALSALSLAQIRPEEQPIQSAFEGLRTRAGLQIQLFGTETIGESSTPLQVDAFWFQALEDGRPVSKVEVVGRRNGDLKYRIVGDGTTVWAWNAERNEYSATRYGNYSGTQPSDYLGRLFAALRTVAGGLAAHPTRLLAEVYAGEQAMYRTWLPGVSVENNGAVVRYMLGNPVRRRFEFAYTTMSPYSSIEKIDFYDRAELGSISRETEWSMTLTPFDIALSEPAFTFVPPDGSRPLASPRPVQG